MELYRRHDEAISHETGKSLKIEWRGKAFRAKHHFMCRPSLLLAHVLDLDRYQIILVCPSKL